MTATDTPSALILQVPGTNRAWDAAEACTLAGARPTIAYLHTAPDLLAYDMLVLPGGFSHGDELGAGRMLGVQLARHPGLGAFVDDGRPVLGICNGFQALVAAGLLPGGDPQVTLEENEHGRFLCQWQELEVEPRSSCLFTRGLKRLWCPIAHREGRVRTPDVETLQRHGQIALRYSTDPNGSVDRIAGLCNIRGNVLGLMPHPENHIRSAQRPGSQIGGPLGLQLFRNAVQHCQVRS